MTLYWNYCQGRVEKEPSDDNCEILRGVDNSIVRESWWVDKNKNSAINFAYTRDNYDRRSFFRSHGINPDDNNLSLRWLMLPMNEYDDLIEYWSESDD